jgi:hypothetical protein
LAKARAASIVDATRRTFLTYGELGAALGVEGDALRNQPATSWTTGGTVRVAAKRRWDYGVELLLDNGMPYSDGAADR